MSASVDPSPETGAGPDAGKEGVGASPGMVTGEAALGMGTGAGLWAVVRDGEMAGVDVGLVVVSAAGLWQGWGRRDWRRSRWKEEWGWEWGWGWGWGSGWGLE